MKQARYNQSHLDSGKFESRAALARFLGVIDYKLGPMPGLLPESLGETLDLEEAPF